jgi:tRNA/tmRNA/rRNA uracil-C5-methylase (TrmA/RlmC/RlmD family)
MAALFCQFMSHDLIFKTYKLADNLTQAERSALRDIQEIYDIIIKPADKRSAVVVMDKTTYIQEAERQLSDCRFYEKLDSDTTQDFTQKITRALEAMHARGRGS